MIVPKTLERIISGTLGKMLQGGKGATPILLWLPIAKLKSAANRCDSLQDYVDLAFSPSSAFPFSISPQQVKEEITELLKILARQKPKYILEVGAARGGTLFLFARVSAPDAVILSLNLPGTRDWRIPLFKSFVTHDQQVRIIRGDSHDFSTLKTVERILQGHKLDFLFLDGDHSYGGVKRDFEMYSPLIGKGGIVAFHDIVDHPFDANCQVNVFWREVKKGHNYVEIIKDRGQRWAGIGIIYV